MFGAIEKTLRLVGTALKVRSYKHDLLASNIANVDTPGYRRKDIPFKKVMETYLSYQGPHISLKTTSPKHIKGYRQSRLGEIIKAYEEKTLGTPNNVSLEEEMVSLTENQVLYETTLQALAKQLQMLNEAITEGGK